VENPEILAVDDEVALLGLVKTYLGRSGFQVVACSSAPEALALLEASPHRFAAAIFDVHIPGMEPRAMLEQARRLAPALPLLLFSGAPFDPRTVPALNQGPMAFLQKPFLPSKLLEAIQKLTSGSAPVA
jgi:two-component system, NtrC family, C4-dicarboxylate transport response regulator DctD